MKRIFKSALPLLISAAGPLVQLAVAQSGSISSTTSQFTTLGTQLLNLMITLAGFAFVGLIAYGAMTLGTNRPRGLACVGGGIFGGLLCGMSYTLVNTLTGQSISH
jgi:hypothetical protein